VRETRDLVALPTAAMRARRHPWALVGLWSWQTLIALGASWPAAALVRTTYGVGPRSDAPLWDAGAHALLDFLWHSDRGLAPVTAAAEMALTIGAIAGLIPMAGAMFATACRTLDNRAMGFMRSMVAALQAMPSLLFLLVTVVVAQAMVIGLGLLSGWAVDALAHDGLGEDRAQRMGLAVGLGFVLTASGLGVVHDLARAAVVRSRASGPRALALGAQVFARDPLPLWWSWAWRAFAAFAPVLAASAIATRIGGRGGGPLVGLAIIHQGVVAWRVACRASWLAKALRSVSPAGLHYADNSDR
jgi:hypothetical protein